MVRATLVLLMTGCSSDARFVPDDGRLDVITDSSPLLVGLGRTGVVCGFRGDGRPVAAETRAFLAFEGGGIVSTTIEETDSSPLDIGIADLVLQEGCAEFTFWPSDPGEVTLRAHSAEVRSDPQVIQVVDEPVSLSLLVSPQSLMEAGAVTATVSVSHGNGTPVEGAFLEATVVPVPDPEPPQWQRTDADGEASWTFSVAETSELTVRLIGPPEQTRSLSISVGEENVQ